LRDSLDAEARRLGAGDGRVLNQVFGCWHELVGTSVASHTRPLSLVQATLVVAVDDAAWGAQLGWLEADLLRRFDEVLGPGVVAALAVRVRPL